MVVNLPSGAKVTLRDKLTAKDKFAVMNSVRTSLNTATGMQESRIGLVNDMLSALLARIVESWTLELPLPSADLDSIGEMDLDDYNALADAIAPMAERILSGSTPNRPGPSSS